MMAYVRRAIVLLCKLIPLSYSWLVSIGVFLLTAVFAFGIVCWSEQERIALERARTLDIATEHTAAIQVSIERALSAAYPLAAMVRQGKGNVQNFEEIATQMLTLYPGVISLQLAPDGIVQEIVPLAGNEKAIGSNAFQDDARAVEALQARDRGQISFSEPFELMQGGLGAAGRLPVFLENNRGEPYFWGFSIVVLQIPELLEDGRLSKLEQKGFAYELWRIHPVDGRKEIIAASRFPLQADPVERVLRVPNADWTLSMTPVAGWLDGYSSIIKTFLAFGFSLLLAWLSRLIINLKDYESRLECMAFLDTLTGLPNRRLLGERLRQAVTEAGQAARLVAVLCLDLDNFKKINDTLGHDGGDQVLMELAERLASCLRNGDTLVRMGGDEFVIILPGLERVDSCEPVLTRLQEAAAAPVVIGHQAVSVTVSIGIALYPRDTVKQEMLLRFADQAMYKAKQQGKGHWEFFS